MLKLLVLDRNRQVLTLQVRVELGVMVLNQYFTCPRSSELEPQYQMQFSVIPRHTFVGDSVSIYWQILQKVKTIKKKKPVQYSEIKYTTIIIKACSIYGTSQMD